MLDSLQLRIPRLFGTPNIHSWHSGSSFGKCSSQLPPPWFNTVEAQSTNLEGSRIQRNILLCIGNIGMAKDLGYGSDGCARYYKVFSFCPAELVKSSGAVQPRHSHILRICTTESAARFYWANWWLMTEEHMWVVKMWASIKNVVS